MDRKTVLATSVLALMLGSGTAGVAVVKPAMDKRDLLRADQARLTGERNKLRTEVAGLNEQLSGMAMNTISYFDLSQDADPPRTLETKTVETLKSLTEIFNDHHIKVQSLEPKGETTGTNKPIPSPSPTPAGGLTGLANTIGNLPGVGAPATPTPDPNAPPSPALISLVHKVYHFQVEGEYPDLVKALTEMQGLPKAISINEYKLKLVALDDDASGGGGEASPAPTSSASLLGLDFQMSITFLLNRPTSAAPPAPAPEPAASPATTGALPSGTWWSALDAWWCPPASAASLQASPKPAGQTVRPWRQLWGGPSRRHAARPTPRPLVLAPTQPKPAAPRLQASRPAAGARSVAARPKPVAALRPRAAQAPLPATRAPHRGPRPALDGLQGFHVVARQGDVLTLSIDPAIVRGLPTPNLASGILGVRSAPGPSGRRLVHLSLAPGQKVRAVVHGGQLVVSPLAGPSTPVVAGRAPNASAQVDAAAEWAKAFGASPPPAVLRTVAPPKPVPAAGDPWQASTDEGRRLLEQAGPGQQQVASPMLWARAGQPTAMRVAVAPARPEVGAPIGPGLLRAVELAAGELRLRTQGPRPRVWVAERRLGRLLLAVEGIEASPKGLSHVVASGGVKTVTVLGPGLRPNTRLVSVSHDPQVRLEVHPGEAGGLRLSVHGRVVAPALADTTPAAGAALLPEQLPAAAQAARPSTRPSPRPTPRPTPMALPRAVARPPLRATPQPLPSTPTRVPAGLVLSASPGPMATPGSSTPTRHFSLPPSSSYRFPIERDRSTGRVNPFRSLPNPLATPLPGPADASGLPVLPAPPGAPPAVPGAPVAPGAPAPAGDKATYVLSAVLVGGGSPPLAVIMVGDQAFQVRLNEVLPGNARVKLIQPDYVVLGLGGQDLRLSLRK